MLKIFKTYIETNLVNNFIQPFKFSAEIPIFLVKKLDKNICFYINYIDVNNLIIKNWYLLPLVDKFFDWLRKAK